MKSFVWGLALCGLAAAWATACDSSSDAPPAPPPPGVGGSDAGVDAEAAAGGSDAGSDAVTEGASGGGGASQWSTVGGKLDHDPGSCCHTFDPSIRTFGGKPVVVWAEDDPTAGTWVRLKSWDGSGWQTIDSPSENDVEETSGHRSPAVALLGSKLLVGWSQLASTTSDQFVRTWDGASWSAIENLTPVQDGDGQDWGWGLSLASSASEAEAVYIARTATDSSQRFKHRSSSGGAFGAESELGTSVEAFSTRAAVSDDGTKQCFIRETGGVGAYELEVFVNGSKAALPPGLPSTEHVQYDVVVHDGAPVVAIVAAGKLSVATLGGSAWTQMGSARLNADASFDGANEPALHSFGGTLYLAWGEKGDQIPGGVFVRRWNGTDWVDLGSSIVMDPDGARQTTDPAMQVIGQDLYLAFTELKSGVYSLWVLRRPL